MTSAEHQPTAEDVMACFDGELSPAQEATIRAHVAGCARCQGVRELMQQTSGELARWTLEEPPSSFQLAGSTVVRVRQPWLSRQWMRRPAIVNLGSLVAVAGIVLSAVVFQSRRSSPGQTASASARTVARAPLAEPSSQSEQRAGGGAGGHAVPGERNAIVAGQQGQETKIPQAANGPIIARWATLDIIASRFDDVSPTIDRMLRNLNGFAGRIDTASARSASRSLNATLRIPAGKLDEAIASLERLGHVAGESRGGDEVTEQVVDLAARLANARNTESRLMDVLRQRTGKVSEVLEAEREISRVREEIERMDAERKNLDRRVTYATVTVRVTEEPKAALDMGPLPVSVRYRNAFVDGVREAFESLLATSLTILRVGPTLAIWVVLLVWPARLVLRRARAR